MFFVNLRGIVGVVLAVLVGHQVDGFVAARAPQFETVGIHAGALFLGLYGLTVDRCEVRGLWASYRANVRNVFAAVSEMGLGKYDRKVVPGRRMAMFLLPVAVAPVPVLLLSAVDAAVRLNGRGAITRGEWFEFVEMPVATLGLWASYALATQWLRLRTNPATRESVHPHF
jgi:hypothetical protein